MRKYLPNSSLKSSLVSLWPTEELKARAPSCSAPLDWAAVGLGDLDLALLGLDSPSCLLIPPFQDMVLEPRSMTTEQILQATMNIRLKPTSVVDGSSSTFWLKVLFRTHAMGPFSGPIEGALSSGLFLSWHAHFSCSPRLSGIGFLAAHTWHAA